MRQLVDVFPEFAGSICTDLMSATRSVLHPTILKVVSAVLLVEAIFGFQAAIPRGCDSSSHGSVNDHIDAAEKTVVPLR